MDIDSDLLLMCCKCSFFVEMDCGIPHRSRLGSVVRNHCSFDADSCGVAVGKGAWRGNCIGSIGNIGGLKEALGSLRTHEVAEGVPEIKDRNVNVWTI